MTIVTRPHPRAAVIAGLLALVPIVTACPGADDITGDTGSMATAPATGPATSDGTADGTAGSDTAAPTAECSYEDTPWTFVDALDMPRIRGVGTEDSRCNPVTTETIALEVQVVIPEGITLMPSGTVRVLLFEYDPDVADASADCVGGLCELLEGNSLVWSFDVPNDQPELGYYIVVDVDTDGSDLEGCVLHETDFVTFAPSQGTLVVPMTANGCV